MKTKVYPNVVSLLFVLILIFACLYFYTHNGYFVLAQYVALVLEGGAISLDLKNQ